MHFDETSMGFEEGLAANRGAHVIATSVLFIVLCTAFLFFRFLAHRVAKSAIFLDDWLVLPAYVLMMGLCVDLILCAAMGDAGKHELWVFENEPEALPRFAQTLFAMEILYSLVIAIEKTSILLLYRRIFGIQRWFRWFVWGMIIYLWVWALIETVIAIVQCIPVSYQWDKSQNGACINQLQTYRWIPLPNVIHDIILLALPTPLIWQLQKVSFYQKMALTIVFLIGSFGCIASMIRMYYMFMLQSTSDQTWQINNLIWTIAEPGSIFICACMPVLWPMIRRLFKLPSEPTKIEGKPGTTVLLPRGWKRDTSHQAVPLPNKDNTLGGSSHFDPTNYDLELLHGVTASEADQRATHHDHLYLGPIRYQVKQDPRLGVPKTEFMWDASRASPARAV